MTTLARFHPPRLLNERTTTAVNRLAVLSLSFVAGELLLVAGAETTLLTAAGLLLFSAVEKVGQILGAQSDISPKNLDSSHGLSNQSTVDGQDSRVVHKFRRPRTGKPAARVPVSVTRQFPHERIPNTAGSRLQILLYDR